MKKRILALILAALLTSSMASCVARSNGETPSGDGGTEPQQTTAPEAPTTDPGVTDSWNTVNKDAYVIADNLTLTEVDDTSKSLKVALMTKVYCLKATTTRSIVEYEGVQYYVNSNYLSTEDLVGANFTVCDPITMYATSGVNMRPYASTNNAFSAAVAMLSQGEAVTVVATGTANGMNWCKISQQVEGETVYYFVSAKYLSNTPGTTAPDDEEFLKYFTDCGAKEMYVIVDYVNVRTAPVVSADTACDTAYKGDKLKVIALGSGDYASWCIVEWPDDVKEGDPQTYKNRYISLTCLDEAQETPAVSLEDFLAEYPELTAGEKQMYVATDALNVRSTPSLTNESNIVGNLIKAAPVKVVASGNINGNNWCLIEYTEGTYRFVGSSALTTNETGEPDPLTLVQLLEKFTDYEAVAEESTVYATGKVNCYTSPASAEAAAQVLEAGTAVKLVGVAKEGKSDLWCIVETEDGVCYFAGTSLFTATDPAPAT